MCIPLFVCPAPILRNRSSRTVLSCRTTPTATAADEESRDSNLDFIKDRIEDVRNILSSPSLPSFPSSDSLPAFGNLPSLSALQRLVAISTFRALAPTPLDHLCPIPLKPSFDPHLALNLAIYAFRAYHEPPSTAYRESFVTPIGARYTIEADLVYPSTEQIAECATGLFLLKFSKPDGYMTASINSATVRNLDSIGHVSLLRIVHPNQPPDDILNLSLYPYPSASGSPDVPSHTASLSLKSIVDTAFQTQGQTSHPSLTLTFDPIDYETHRIDYFQETLLPTGLRLPFMINSDHEAVIQKPGCDLKVTVEASFLPFDDKNRSDGQSDPLVSSEEGEGENLEETWSLSEAVQALGDAIQEAAEEGDEAERSLTVLERRRKDALAFILSMQLPKQTMPAPTDWNRLVAAANSLMDRLPEMAGHVKSLDVNASACLFVESLATDTEVWFFRDSRHESLVVSFRGTEQVSWKDFFTDAQMFLQRWIPGEDIDLTVSGRNTVGLSEFVPSVVGKSDAFEQMGSDVSAVHYGFLRAYLSVRDAVDRGISLLTEGERNYRLLFTGHSLGGALATVAAVDYAARRGGPVCCMSYGAPKVGNVNFARRFNELVPNAFRIVNDSDLVSRMPRSLSGGGAVDRYKHSGRTVLVNDFGDYWVEGENDDLLIDSKSSVSNPFRERYKDLKELIDHEKQLWEQLLSGISVKHHMEDSYFKAIQQVIIRAAGNLDKGSDDQTV